MTKILDRPQQYINPTSLSMWVDESIWGHRLYDEQTPWLCILEMLCITQSAANINQAFVEEDFNNLKYKSYSRLHLRNILFNNPYMEAIAVESLDDSERWQRWMDEINKNVGGIDSPDFSYLKSRFVSFKDFLEVVKFLQSNAIEGDSNKRWSSKFVFPYGPDCLYEDLRISGVNTSNDRRFFARTGELLYLMLCRSGRGREILSHLQKIGIIAGEFTSNDRKGSKWNQLVSFLQPPSEEQDKPRESKEPPYLPYPQLPDYERLAEDWLSILDCNLPDYDALPHIVAATGLHLIIYLLNRSHETLAVKQSASFVLEIVAPKKTTIRELSSKAYQENNELPRQAIEYYIRGTADLPEWKACLNSHNRMEDAIDFLRERFAWPPKEEELDISGSPESLLNSLREKAVKRHQQHLAKCHASWTREIGLSSSRGSRRTRYAPTDALLKTLVLTSVPTRMEFQEFLLNLHDKYGFIIGDRQAESIIKSGNADRADFVANAERLERRLASIGLLRRLSDACAYVQNPFALEVK
jgi:hypothetical protein